MWHNLIGQFVKIAALLKKLKIFPLDVVANAVELPHYVRRILPSSARLVFANHGWRNFY